MKLIIHFELATKTTVQLHGLYKELFNRCTKCRKKAAAKQAIEHELSNRSFNP